MNGNAAAAPNPGSDDSNATSGAVGLKAKYQSSTAIAWVSAAQKVSTPRCRRLYSSGRNRRSSRASGPIASARLSNRNAQLPQARIAKVCPSISRPAACNSGPSRMNAST